MREKELNQLHVMGRHGHQIPGAAAQQVGRRQLVELLDQRDAHFRQHAKCHVVGDPGFRPVKNARERSNHGENHQKILEGRAILDRGHHQRDTGQ